MAAVFICFLKEKTKLASFHNFTRYVDFTRITSLYHYPEAAVKGHLSLFMCAALQGEIPSSAHATVGFYLIKFIQLVLSPVSLQRIKFFLKIAGFTLSCNIQVVQV